LLIQKVLTQYSPAAIKIANVVLYIRPRSGTTVKWDKFSQDPFMFISSWLKRLANDEINTRKICLLIVTKIGFFSVWFDMQHTVSVSSNHSNFGDETLMMDC